MQKSSGTEPEVKIEVKTEVKTEVKAETAGEVEPQEGEQVEPQEGEQVEPQEGERKKKARRGTRSAAAQAIRWETDCKYFPGAAILHDIFNDDDGTDDGPNAGAGELSAASRSQSRTSRAASSTDTTGAGADATATEQQKGQMKGRNCRGYESGIGSFASKYQPPSFEGEDEKWKEWARVFRSWSGRFYDGELGVVYEHVESKRNEPAGISDLPLSLVSGREEKLRAMASELYHVLVMLTRGRAQKLVLKAGEPEGFEAYRLLLRLYEPQTTATTVTKLVELLSTQFAGDLLDCVTDFERRVAVWESEAGEQLSDLIKIGVVVKGLEKGNFRDHLLINTSGTKQWSRFIKEIEAVELARLNSRPTPMDLSAVGHDQPKRFEGNCSWCCTYGHMARNCWKKAAA